MTAFHTASKHGADSIVLSLGEASSPQLGPSAPSHATVAGRITYATAIRALSTGGVGDRINSATAIEAQSTGGATERIGLDQ